MNAFEYKKGDLYCEEVKLANLVAEIGSPVYVYSKTAILNRLEALKTAFAEIPHLICFSVKSCQNINILRALGEAGAGADIVSGGELYRALKAGIPAKKIVYSGVGKSVPELKEAIPADILMFNIESEQEVQVLDEMARSMNKKIGVALRVNPDVDPDTHEKITTGKKENKFGVSFLDAERVYMKIKDCKNLEILGIDCHIGSQIMSPAPYVKAARVLKNLHSSLEKAGINIRYLDIGGGFGIRYGDETPAAPEEFKNALLPVIKDMGVELIMEPGRFIVGNSGALITRALFNKKGGDKNFLIVNAGMNDLIRPTLYEAHHSVLPLLEANGSLEEFDVVGPICETGDYLAKSVKLPRTERGGLIAVMSAGAYGFTMASNYNSRPRAAEVLVEGDSFKVIRRRETYEDLVAQEE